MLSPGRGGWVRGLVGLLAAAGVACSSESPNQTGLPSEFEVPERSETRTWLELPVGGSFSAPTEALTLDHRVLFFHQDNLTELNLTTRKWSHQIGVLPFRVDQQFAAVAANGLVYAIASQEPHFYRLDPETGSTTALEPPPVPPRSGARITFDGQGNLYAIPAGGHPKDGGSKALLRYDLAAATWHSESGLESVNNPGYFSTGLFSIDGALFTYGDHHVARRDPTTQEWNKLFNVMRYRPFVHRGGMSALDAETQSYYVTLGGGSNSLGVITVPTAKFYYLRPRLPLDLEEPGRTLFVAPLDSTKHLFLLSNDNRAIYAIPTNSLELIGPDPQNRRADIGSAWDSQNTSRVGAHGGLFRHKDSYASGVFLAPHFYYQRKNVLRRVDPLTSRVSPVRGLFPFHRKFSTQGAAITTDGDQTLYLYTGHDTNFFAVDIAEAGSAQSPTTELGETYVGETNLGNSSRGYVRALAPLPEAPGLNTAAAYFDRSVFVILSSTTGALHRYSPQANEWSQVGTLAGRAGAPDIAASDTSILSLIPTSDSLWLIASDTLFEVIEDASQPGLFSFEQKLQLQFTPSDDGGMTAWDPDSNRIYISMGDRSRGLGVLDLGAFDSYIAEVEFPDVVSVAGQRMFVLAGHLYIYRGHDSAELWRIPTDQIARPD